MHVDDLECYHVLYGIAGLLHPRSYLEVGVREGASLCCVLAAEPEVVPFTMRVLMDGRTHLTPEIVERIRDTFSPRDAEMRLDLFENWSYRRGDGGHDRIVQLVEQGFTQTNYAIHDGDSQETLPPFLDALEAPVDLAFIDGDHSRDAAWTDLTNIAGHFKVLVVHDLFHPQHGYLHDVFTQYVRMYEYPSFVVGRHYMGTGVAFNLE